MSKCNVCNSNLGIFSTKRYCDRCKNDIIKKINNLQQNNILLNNDLAKKGKKINYYLEIYSSLIEVQKEVEYIHSVAPDILINCETTETYLNRINANVLDFINEQIEIILEKNSLDNNKKEINKDLKKLYEEVSESKILYKHFSETLTKCQENIKKHFVEEIKSTKN